MRDLKALSLVVVLAGSVMTLSALSQRVNPDTNLAILGIFAAFSGLLLLTFDFLKGLRFINERRQYFLWVFWPVFSSGLLLWLYGLSLGGMVACFGPLGGGGCSIPQAYSDVVTVGEAIALVGGIGVLVGLAVPRRNKDQSVWKPRLKGRTASTVSLAVTFIAVLGFFSYSPAVTITSIFQVTQFPHGADLRVIPFYGFVRADSPTSHGPVLSGSGEVLPVGGSFDYVLVFRSVQNFSSYTVSHLGVGQGFSILKTNPALPVSVSSSQPNASVDITIQAPYYPYYGPLGVEINVTQ
ncbi:MAG: hypothetical protein HY247_06675 [archaeon]|nr:MAG: hypothetical protein HY247_06675 [archaeon]